MTTGRERFRAAFEFDGGDRVPLFEQSITSSVAGAVLGREAHTGGMALHWHAAVALYENRYEAFVERVTRDLVAYARETGLDALGVPWMRSSRPVERADERSFLYEDTETGRRELWRYDAEVGTYGCASAEGPEPTVAQIVNREERALAEKPPKIEDYTFAQRFYEAAGRDLAWIGKSGFMAIPMDPKWLEATLLEPELVARYLDVQLEMGLRGLEIEKELGVDAVWAGGDCCAGAGPVYSPATFRDLVLPRLKKLVAKCEELGIGYLFRSDGVTWPLADMLFKEAGCHAYGEIDQEAGMDLALLRARFERLVLWGGVPCGTVLHHGSTAEVRAAAHKAIADAHRGGGLILGSSNTIMHNTPPENVRALCEVARESRW